MQSVNGAQSLNITLLSLSSACFAAASYLMYCLTNLLFFDIPFLYYYINFRSPIIFCLSSRDIFLSLVITVSLSAVESETE